MLVDARSDSPSSMFAGPDVFQLEAGVNLSLPDSSDFGNRISSQLRFHQVLMAFIQSIWTHPPFLLNDTIAVLLASLFTTPAESSIQLHRRYDLQPKRRSNYRVGWSKSRRYLCNIECGRVTHHRESRNIIS